MSETAHYTFPARYPGMYADYLWRGDKHHLSTTPVTLRKSASFSSSPVFLCSGTRKSNLPQESFRLGAPVTTWTLHCQKRRAAKKTSGRVEAQTCELLACPTFPPSGTERVLVDGPLDPGLILKPGGCLRAGGGGRTGGTQLGYGL